METRVKTPDPNSGSWIFPSIADVAVEFAREGASPDVAALALGIAESQARTLMIRGYHNGLITDAEAAAIRLFDAVEAAA